MQNVSRYEQISTHRLTRVHSFVTAVRKDAGNNRSPVFLRSYKPNYTALDKNDILELLPEIKVWEAARATSAAPAYFKPFAIKKYELLDGGLGANNPLGW